MYHCVFKSFCKSMSKMYFKLYQSIISNAASGNGLKKTRSGSAVSGEVGAKGEEFDRLREATSIVSSTRLVVVLLPGVVPYHPQPEKTMLLVVEGYRGADVCLESRETLS